MLKVVDMVNQEILTFVYNYFANCLPSTFNNYYETLVSTPGINTRHGSNLLKKVKQELRLVRFPLNLWS